MKIEKTNHCHYRAGHDNPINRSPGQARRGQSKQTNLAFTLVELIIVITILAILRTIGFMSFQTYTTDARDSNRITTIKELSNGLELYQIKNTSLPDPDDKIEISNSSLFMGSGGIVGYQGNIGTNVVNSIKMTSLPLDPKDNTKYIYYKSLDGKKYQIISYLENIISTTNIYNTYATDLSNRTVKSVGQKLGIILDSNNNPIVGSGGKFDIMDSTNTIFKIYNNKLETVTLTGGYLFSNSYANTSTGGTSCNTPDIVIYGQDGKIFTIAACNMGANIAWESSMGYTGASVVTANYITNKNYEFLGNYYQWGRNDPVGVVNGTKLFIESGTGKYNGQYKEEGVDLTGSGFITNSGSYYKSWIDDESHRLSNVTIWKSGVCPIGYHMPSEDDYKNLMYILTNQIGRCDGSICNNKIALFQNKLKLPILGAINSYNGSFLGFGSQGFYWTKDISRYIDLKPNSYYLTNGALVTRGMPIRCFKD